MARPFTQMRSVTPLLLALAFAFALPAPASRAQDQLDNWRIDNLISWVEGQRKDAGALERELFPFPDRQGMCPGWGDRLASYFAAYSRECSEAIVFSRYRAAQAAAAAVQACMGSALDDPLDVLRAGEACKDSPVTPADLAQLTGEDITEAVKQFNDLRDQLREQGLRATIGEALDASSLWKELATCSLKAVATAGEMTEGERGEWRNLMDLMAGSLLDAVDFTNFARSVAAVGPMSLIKQKLPTNQREAHAFVVETSGLKDALEKAVQERLSTVRTGVSGLTGVKEGDLIAEVRAVGDDIGACRLDKAEDDAEVLANKLLARIGELRHRVAIAEKALICKASSMRIFEPEASSYTNADRSLFLRGFVEAPNNPAGRPVSVTEFSDWRAKVNVHNALVDAYIQLRERASQANLTRKRQEIVQLATARAARIGGLLKAASQQIAHCENRAESGVALSFETLREGLEAERAYLGSHRCSGALNASLGGLLDQADQGIRELRSAELGRNNARAILADAERDIGGALAGCAVGTAFDNWSKAASELQRLAQLPSFGPDACYGEQLEELKTKIESQASALSRLADQTDRAISEARENVEACDKPGAEAAIERARALLADSPCAQTTEATSRRRLLVAMEEAAGACVAEKDDAGGEDSGTAGGGIVRLVGTEVCPRKITVDSAKYAIPEHFLTAYEKDANLYYEEKSQSFTCWYFKDKESLRDEDDTFFIELSWATADDADETGDFCSAHYEQADNEARVRHGTLAMQMEIRGREESGVPLPGEEEATRVAQQFFSVPPNAVKCPKVEPGAAGISLSIPRDACDAVAARARAEGRLGDDGDPSGILAVAAAVQAEPTVLGCGRPDGETLVQGGAVHIDDHIVTGSDGRVRLEFLDRDEKANSGPSVVYIAPESTVRVESFRGPEAEQVGLEVFEGAVRAISEGTPDPRRSFRVKAGAATLSLHEPDGVVYRLGDVTAVMLNAGEATVSLSGQAVDVAPQEGLAVEKGSIGKKEAIAPDVWTMLLTAITGEAPAQ